eukprot:12666065-Ditylum_brightwellii.AAC.1
MVQFICVPVKHTLAIDTDGFTTEFLKELHYKPSDPPEINAGITLQYIKSNYKTGMNRPAHTWRDNTL